MTGRGAFRNYGYGQKPRPKDKVNKGVKIEDNVDDNGKDIPTYKNKNDPSTILSIRAAIANSIQAEYPIVGDELVHNELSMYAAGPLMNEDQVIAPPPSGLGPRPPANNIAAVEAYRIAEEGLRKRYLTKQGQYLEDVKAVKGFIKTKFVAPTVLIAIQRKPRFMNAQREHVSVANFLNALEEAIRQNSDPVLTNIQRNDLNRDELEQNLHTKIIKNDCSKYLEEMRDLMSKYRQVLKDEKISKIPNNSTVNQRAARIVIINEEVQVDTDRDQFIISRVYSLIKRFGMDGDQQDVYKLKETTMGCTEQNKKTPFTRKVNELDGTVTGGFDNMIEELLQIVRVQESKFGGQPIFYQMPKSDGERPLKKPKIDINAATQDVAVPCSFCRDELHFDAASKSHQIEHCIYNAANTGYYVGDAKKEERLKRAKEYQASKASGRPGQFQGRGRGRYGRGRGRGRRGRGG